MKGARRRAERQEYQRRWAVWHTAALMGAKHFPSHSKFNPPPGKTGDEPPTPEELLRRFDSNMSQGGV